MPWSPLNAEPRSLPPWRVESATGRVDPSILGKVTVSSGDAWRGLQLDEVTLSPAEQPKGYLGYHAVMVHTGQPVDIDATWTGGPPRTYRLGPGAVTLFPAWEIYRMRWQAPLQYVLVRMAPESVSRLTDSATAGALRPQVAVEDQLVPHLVMALRKEAEAPTPAGSLYAETLGTALITHLVREYGRGLRTQARFRGGLPQQALRRVQEYVEANLAAELHLPELAGIAGVSVRHFVRAFRESTSMTPHRFVIARRVDRASVLLSDRDLTVAEIARRCGFESPSRFAAAFRRMKDIAPAAYRKAVSSEPRDRAGGAPEP